MQVNKRRIRESVRDLILNHTQAGEQVFTAPVVSHWVQNLPAINIFTESETVERFNESPKSYRRVMTLVIECVAVGDSEGGLDNNLEELGDAVESFMEIDETLGQCVNKLELVSTDYDYKQDGQSLTGSLILRYTIEYFTDAIRPDMQCLDDLNQINVDYKIGHHNESPDDIVEAQDEYNFEGV